MTSVLCSTVTYDFTNYLKESCEYQVFLSTFLRFIIMFEKALIFIILFIKLQIRKYH